MRGLCRCGLWGGVTVSIRAGRVHHYLFTPTIGHWAEGRPLITYLPPAVPRALQALHYLYADSVVCVTFFYINHHNGYDTHRHRPKTRHRTPPGARRSSKLEQRAPRRRSRCMATRRYRRGRGDGRNTRGRSMAKQKDVVRAELTGRWGWVAERWAEEERQKWRERSAWRQSPQAGR